MEDWNIRRKCAGPDKLAMFKAALFAETDGADIPAPVTLDTFLELVHPPVETFFFAIHLNIFQRQIVIHANLLFVRADFFRL
jgi:hypothetical protein